MVDNTTIQKLIGEDPSGPLLAKVNSITQIDEDDDANNVQTLSKEPASRNEGAEESDYL